MDENTERKPKGMTDKQFKYMKELELAIIRLSKDKEEAERILKEAKEKALQTESK